MVNGKKRKRSKRDGRSKTAISWVWRSMIDRCRLPSHQAWKNYGGRGIAVCESWINFENFLTDMGPSYVKGLSLDRRDNNGGYNPSNCRWTSRKTQARNRRTNTIIQTPWGRITLQEASERSGIGKTTLHYRHSRGWPNHLLFVKPDARNVCTTFQIAVRENS